MKTRLFVISDLHLGGEPGEHGAPGFQMCPERNQKRLAAFIAGLPKAPTGEQTRLVLAGDIVDFLAEREFAAFTRDEGAALKKLESVIGRTKPVWDALSAFVRSGGYLTLMLGNHDVELSLPAVRRSLLKGLGEGRVEFIYDNEAFTLGPVLIEHGNRYDSWNAVPHGSLRRARSQASRRLPTSDFPAMPGSQLVAEVMNDLKRQYSWVDLLKPETSGALPILAALGASNLKRIWKAFRKHQASLEVEYRADGEPLDDEYIAAAAGGDASARDQVLWDLAQDIASGGSAEQVGFLDDALHTLRRGALRKALRAMAKQHQLTYDTTREDETYLKPAQAAAERDFEVIVYGHTHLPKNIEIETSKGRKARYLNTGTWADLIRMPDAVFAEDDAASSSSLDAFVTDLGNDDVGRWRHCAPTFADITLEGAKLVRAELRFADEAGSEPVTTRGLIRRLSGE